LDARRRLQTTPGIGANAIDSGAYRSSSYHVQPHAATQSSRHTNGHKRPKVPPSGEH
jgi:hypothetical protein